MKIKALVVAIAFLMVVSACEAATEAPTAEATVDSAGTPIEGVWHVVEMISADSATAPLIDPPSLYIFTDTHYSMMYVIGDLPRALYAAVDPTDSEKIAAHDTYISNAGTYQVSGSTVVTTPVVAKNPNFMSGGRDQYQFRVVGDTLWLTSTGGDLRLMVGGQLVPPSAPPVEVTSKLVRVQ